MQKRLSIKAIAKDLNISTTTISFVLNDKALDKRISPAVIDKVKEYIKKIGYQPNRTAQCLRTGKSKMIVFMVEDISNPFFAGIAKTLERRLFQEGYTTIYCSTDGNRDKTRRLIRQFNDLGVDGYIITPPPTFSTGELKQLITHGKTILLLDDKIPDSSDRYESIADILALLNPAPSTERLGNDISKKMLGLLCRSPEAFPG